MLIASSVVGRYLMSRYQNIDWRVEQNWACNARYACALPAAIGFATVPIKS